MIIMLAFLKASIMWRETEDRPFPVGVVTMVRVCITRLLFPLTRKRALGPQRHSAVLTRAGDPAVCSPFSSPRLAGGGEPESTSFQDPSPSWQLEVAGLHLWEKRQARKMDFPGAEASASPP